MAETQIVRRAAEHLSQGTDGSSVFVDQVAGWSDSLDAASYVGLLPLAITLMILHEMYFATTEDRAPRIGWMLLRIVGFGACLAGYDRIVGLLTGLVGGSGAWPETADLISPLEYGLRTNMDLIGLMQLNNLGETLGPFLIWAILFTIDCMLALFAVVVVTVLVKIQALLLVIFIASGKTCLILSIMPGVSLGKSWAKAVATVAAWGAMGGVVYGAVGFAGHFSNFAASSNLQAHFQIWLAYALIGIFFMSIPKLVGALVSGSMTAAPGLSAAVGGGLLAAKFLSPKIGGGGGGSRRPQQADRGAEGGEFSRRGGKVERGRSGRSGAGPQSGVPGAARDGQVSPRAAASDGQRKHQTKSAHAIEESDQAGANGGHQKFDRRAPRNEHQIEQGGEQNAAASSRNGGADASRPAPARHPSLAHQGEAGPGTRPPQVGRRAASSSAGASREGESADPRQRQAQSGASGEGSPPSSRADAKEQARQSTGRQADRAAESDAPSPQAEEVRGQEQPKARGRASTVAQGSSANHSEFRAPVDDCSQPEDPIDDKRASRRRGGKQER